MGDPVMELTQSQLQQIADYVKSQIPDWVYRSDPPNQELSERMLAIEEAVKAQGERMLGIGEELKAQREFMATRFEAIDRRFEVVDRRFESMDKRFEAMDQRFVDSNQRLADTQRYMEKRFDTLQWMWAGGFLLVTVLMSLYQFVG